MTRLKFLKSAVITASTVLVVLSSFGDKESIKKMAMTTTASEVSFSLDGTGKVTVNWGNGAEILRLQM